MIGRSPKPCTMQLLDRKPLSYWLSRPPFRGTYIIYDRPDRAYYVGESSVSIPGRLRSHLSASGVVTQYALADGLISGDREKAIATIKQWEVAVTQESEWLMQSVLRPVHGPRPRQTFYYRTVRDLGVLMMNRRAPRHGEADAFILALNKRMKRR